MASLPASSSINRKLPPDPGNPILRDFRVEFLPKASPDPFNVPSALRAVFTKLASVDPSISFYSSIGNNVIDLSSFPTSTFTEHFKHEQFPRPNGLSKLIVLFSAKTFKNSAAFSSSLRPWFQSTNTWLHDHTFGAETIRIVDLGYLFCRHPFRTYRDDLLSSLRSFFDDSLAKASFDDSDLPSSVPHFELRRRPITHHLKPDIRLPTESATIRVDTFVLRCSADATSFFLSLLQDEQLPSSIGVFSPASIRSQQHYSLLTDLIREHTHFLVNSRFLTIQGLPSQSLSDSLRSKLVSILPDSRLERTNSTATQGTWFLLYIGDDASSSSLKQIDSILSRLACKPDDALKQARLSCPSAFDSCPRRVIPHTRKIEDMASAIHRRNNARTKSSLPVPKFVTPSRSLQLSFVDSEDITLGSAQPSSVTPVTNNTRTHSSNHTIHSQLTIETLHSTLVTVTKTLEKGLENTRSDFQAAMHEMRREREQDRAMFLQLINSLQSSSPARKLRRSGSGRTMDLDSVPPSPSPAAPSAKSPTDGPATPSMQHG